MVFCLLKLCGLLGCSCCSTEVLWFVRLLHGVLSTEVLWSVRLQLLSLLEFDKKNI